MSHSLRSPSLRQLASAVGDEVVRDVLVSAFVQLLKDNEAEVRTAGAGQIPGAWAVNRHLHCIRLPLLLRRQDSPS